MDTTGNQTRLSLSFGVLRGPKNAQTKVVRQIESEAQALAVSIRAGHHKLDYIAACVGKKRSYISKLQRGRQAIPERLIDPLCAATGSNLLRQFHDLQARLLADEEAQQIERLAAELRAA